MCNSRGVSTCLDPLNTSDTLEECDMNAIQLPDLLDVLIQNFGMTLHNIKNNQLFPQEREIVMVCQKIVIAGNF